MADDDGHDDDNLDDLFEDVAFAYLTRDTLPLWFEDRDDLFGGIGSKRIYRRVASREILAKWLSLDNELFCFIEYHIREHLMSIVNSAQARVLIYLAVGKPTIVCCCCCCCCCSCC